VVLRRSIVERLRHLRLGGIQLITLSTETTLLKKELCPIPAEPVKALVANNYAAT